MRHINKLKSTLEHINAKVYNIIELGIPIIYICTGIIYYYTYNHVLYYIMSCHMIKCTQYRSKIKYIYFIILI